MISVSADGEQLDVLGKYLTLRSGRLGRKALRICETPTGIAIEITSLAHLAAVSSGALEVPPITILVIDAE